MPLPIQRSRHNTKAELALSRDRGLAERDAFSRIVDNSDVEERYAQRGSLACSRASRYPPGGQRTLDA